MALHSPHAAFRAQLRILERPGHCRALARRLTARAGWACDPQDWHVLNDRFAPRADCYAWVAMRNGSDPRHLYLLLASLRAAPGTGPDWSGEQDGVLGHVALHRQGHDDALGDLAVLDPGEEVLVRYLPGRVAVYRAGQRRRELRPGGDARRIAADARTLTAALPAGGPLEVVRPGTCAGGSLLYHCWREPPLRGRLRSQPALLADAAAALQALWDSNARPHRQTGLDALYWHTIEQAQALTRACPGLADSCARISDRLTAQHARLVDTATWPCLGGRAGTRLRMQHDGRCQLSDPGALLRGAIEDDVLDVLGVGVAGPLGDRAPLASESDLPRSLRDRIDPAGLRAARLRRGLQRAVWLTHRLRSEGDGEARSVLAELAGRSG